jgi:hypothetical protein
LIPVEQRASFDCMTACLASIFEVPYEDAPVLADPETCEPVDQWLRVMTLWLHDRGFHPQNFTLTAHQIEHHGESPQHSPWHWPTFWMAGVKSPRYEENGEPGLHCVVMQGNDLVWDPHPQREMGHLGFWDADVFLPIDPAQLVARAALVDADQAASVAHDFIWDRGVSREKASEAIWTIHRALRPRERTS